MMLFEGDMNFKNYVIRNKILADKRSNIKLDAKWKNEINIFKLYNPIKHLHMQFYYQHCQ